MRRLRQHLALLAFCAIAGCSAPALPDLSGLIRLLPPAMRWDHLAQGAAWTRAALAAVAQADGVLASKVPGDIAAFCPAYPGNSLPERRAFWAGLLSSIAERESGLNPKASGAGGRYIGLMQIAPSTARAFGCEAQSAQALKDGAANLSCAVQIAAAQVGRDGAIAGKGRSGLARDWGPMKRTAKRAEIAEWTAAQTYCR